MKLIRIGFVIACSLLLLVGAGITALAENVVYLSSLEWPPYVGKKLPEQGESSKIVREAFAAMGYKVEIVFAPWKRAMRMSYKGINISGFFPEYYSAHRNEKIIYSDSFGCSEIGLFSRGTQQVSWEKVDDLKKYRLGAVAGYINTAEFDKAAANGTLTIDYAPDDMKNILKVARGRVDCAVVDPKVVEYYSRFSDDVKKVKMHPRLLGVNALHVVFRDNELGRKLVRVFNEGLKKIRSGKVSGCTSMSHQ